MTKQTASDEVKAPERVWLNPAEASWRSTPALCPVEPIEYIRADLARPVSTSPDAEQLIQQWRSTLQNESRITDEDAEDLMFRVIAFSGARPSPSVTDAARKAAEALVAEGLIDQPSLEEEFKSLGRGVDAIAAIILRAIGPSLPVVDAIGAVVELRGKWACTTEGPIVDYTRAADKIIAKLESLTGEIK